MAFITKLKQLTEDGWAVLLGSLIIIAFLGAAWLFPQNHFTVPAYKWITWDDLQRILSLSPTVIFLLFGALGFGLLFLLSNPSGGKAAVKRAGGFLIIYLLAIVSLFISGNASVSTLGIEYVVFALLLGLVLNNFFRLPNWIREAARSEFFIKTGLVILGSSVLFTDIVKAGLPGIVQAFAVVLLVWFFTFWLGRKLKLDDEFGVILASAVSICGVSAAIVAAGAIGGDKKKLSYVTTLVLLVAIPMLILQPWIISHFGLSQLVAGAWLGGTLDTTASVTAAAELVGPQALKVGVIIKFSQNVLIGLAAFLIATWWVVKKKQAAVPEAGQPGILKSVWDRFPRFVLAFILVSAVFSFLLSPATVKQVNGALQSIRTLWFALAFVSIGLEARFKDLLQDQGTKPAVVFVTAQLFNILWTLLIAYLLFSGKLFPVPVIG